MSSGSPTRVRRDSRRRHGFLIALRAAALGALAALAACATPETDRVMAAHPGLPASASIADAPFVAQRTRECGPAALAMALKASHVAADADALVKEVYTPGRGGSLTTGIVTAARRHGRLAYPVNSLRALLTEVAQGRPVIVLQNLALEVLPQWHYAVAVGFDLDTATLYLHSGTTPRKPVALATFEHTWKRGHNWGLVLLKPGTLPQNPDRVAYVKAVAGLERARRLDAAVVSYRKALEVWPEDLAAMIGLGNALYGLGRSDDALDAFRAAAAAHPSAAAAHNNLAHLYLEKGQPMQALTAARRAVALGGKSKPIYEKTLREVEQALAPR